MACLFIIIIALVVDNIEESELVDTFASRDNAQPVTELLLLKKLLCPAQLH